MITCVFALTPTTLPNLVKATWDGIVRSPSSVLMTVGLPSRSKYTMQLQGGAGSVDVPDEICNVQGGSNTGSPEQHWKRGFCVCGFTARWL